jgi:hypothetical protein
MGWDHQERQKRLAPIGEYRPEVHRVTVHDTFEQLHLQMAAGAIHGGMGVSEFILFAARYVLRNHRDLRHVARFFRKGAREIKSAVQAPIGSNVNDPERERHLRHRSALDRFRKRAWTELSRPEGKP